MIKNLWITEITDEVKLRKVLDILGDDTWTEDNVKDMVSNKYTEISYDEVEEGYLFGEPFGEEMEYLIKLTYQEFIDKYSDKDNLIKDIKFKPKTQYLIKVILPNYESTSESVLNIVNTKEEAFDFLDFCNLGLDYFVNKHSKHLIKHNLECNGEYEVVNYLEKVRKILIKQNKYSFLTDICFCSDFIPYFDLKEINCYSWNNNLEDVSKSLKEDK